jgi:uncharacterized protein (DUF58 family)
VHLESIFALVLILLTFAAHMLLPSAAERAVTATAEPETVRQMRERVEALAAQLRAGEITFHDWQAQMAAFRSDAYGQEA